MDKKDDFLVDCMITAGESDPDHYGKWLDNNLRHCEVAKSNIPYSQFLDWANSKECLKRVMELEKIGRDKLGEDYWMRYSVCCFCTMHVDKKENHDE